MSGLPPEPTGVVWNNPDDFGKARRGEPGVRRANPGNVSLDDYLGTGKKIRYGERVMGTAKDSTEKAAPVGRAPEVSVAEQLAQSPEIAGEVASGLVAAHPGERKPVAETVQKTLVALGSFARMLTSESEEVKAQAQTALTALVDQEYGRPEGPRKMVVDKLTKLGLAREG